MASITFNVPQDRKDAFTEFCRQTGLNVTTALNVFMVATLQEGRIPFSIKVDPFYSERNLAELEESIAEADRGEFAASAMADDFSRLVEDF